MILTLHDFLNVACSILQKLFMGVYESFVFLTSECDYIAILNIIEHKSILSIYIIYT